MMSWSLNGVLLSACLSPAGNSKPLGLIFLLERVLGGADQGTRSSKKMRSGNVCVCYRSVCGSGAGEGAWDLLLI